MYQTIDTNALAGALPTDAHAHPLPVNPSHPNNTFSSSSKSTGNPSETDLKHLHSIKQDQKPGHETYSELTHVYSLWRKSVGELCTLPSS